MTGPTEEQLALIANVTQASFQMTMDASDELIKSLQWTLDCTEAELQLIREEVGELCNNPWTPNSGKVMAMLWPPMDRVHERARQIQADRESRVK